jgi:hypothetical protein
MTRCIHSFVFPCILAVFVTACSTGNVIQVGPDTFSVTSTGAGFSTDGVRKNVYSSANSYCAQKALVMVESSIKVQAGRYGSHPPNADLVFRCLKDGDPEIARRTAGIQGVMIGTLETKEDSEDLGDSYAELKQLKELLDSGALTQEEFDMEKAKILAQH